MGCHSILGKVVNQRNQTNEESLQLPHFWDSSSSAFIHPIWHLDHEEAKYFVSSAYIGCHSR
jgi:hypothetical protein